MNNRNKRRPPRRLTIKRVVTTSVLAVAVFIGWSLRDFFGLGFGGLGNIGRDQVETTKVETKRDSGPPQPTQCRLRLSSKGLTLNGKSIKTAEAVRMCRNAKDVKLRVTGGARSGTYDEVKRAFEQADIPVHVRDGRAK